MRMRNYAAAGAVVALVLAACGNGDDPASEPDEPTSEEPTDEEEADEQAAADGVPDNPSEGVPAGEIVLGWMGDLTGPTASQTAQLLRGTEAYFELVNQEGGVLDREIVVVSRDDEYSAEAGVTNYRALVGDERVLGLINIAGSHISTALIPDIEADQIAVIGPSQTIDAQLESPYMFHTLAHYADMADVALARLAEKIDGEPSDLVAVAVNLEVPSGAEWADFIGTKVPELGGTYAGNLNLAPDQTDFASPVAQIQQLVEDEGVNAIAFHGSPATALGLATAMDDVDLRIPVGGIQTLANLSVYTEGPQGMLDLMEGTHSFVPCTVDTPGTQRLLEFTEGTEWEGECESISWIHGWVNGMVAHQAIERAAEDHGELNRETFFQALQGTYDIEGLSCDYDWTDANYSPCAAPFTWDGTSLTPAAPFEEWLEIMEATGAGA